jgi:4-amino-4-deoxy-L-arabinose transferase-like glycosyltransferase
MISRPRLFLFFVIIGSAGLYLLGNGSVDVWDRDEPRYAQTSRQMLQSGDWVVPHYLDLVRTAKPALIYWCQASTMALFGDNAFAARLPSALAMTILLVLLSIVLWRHIGPQRTAWTVFIFATSGLVIAAAKMCITDAVLLLWVTIAQLCLYAMWRKNFSWLVVIVMSVAMGLAGLTKGPVILGVQGMTIVILVLMRWTDKRWPPRENAERRTMNDEMDAGLSVHRSSFIVQRSSQPIPGLPPRAIKESLFTIFAKIVVGLLITTAIVLPWVLMVNHRSAQFLQHAVSHDVWDRMMTPLEQHTGPPGYYLMTIWVTFFPWSLLLPLAIGLAIRHRRDPQIRFALAAVIGPWIMLECIRTKLPHYLLPAYPPLAFLTADALVRCFKGEFSDLKSTGFRIGLGIWAILIALASSAPWVAMLAYHDALPISAMVAISLFGILFPATVFVLFLKRRYATASLAMGVGMMILVALMYGWYLPRADFLRISPRVAQILISHNVTHPHQVIMMDYMEPSLAFDQGGTMREAGEVTLSRKCVKDFTPWMVVTADVWKRAPQEIRDRFDVVGSVYGLAYADKARWVEVMVIRRKMTNDEIRMTNQ